MPMNRAACRVAIFLGVLMAAWTTGLHAQADGPIVLTVDATQAPMKILHSHMVMPVKPGPLTLYYPKWIPGLHEPAGPIGNVAGLKFGANGKAIPWERDLSDVFTFHVVVPAGVTRLDIDMDYLEPSSFGGPAAGSATDKLLDLTWNQVLLYPAGTAAARIVYHAAIVLPAGWKFGTALPVEHQSSNRVTFHPVALNRLVDSPLIAGEYYRSYDVTPSGEPIHHEIDLVADSGAALAMSPVVQKALANLVAQEVRLFGSPHYRDYHFLVTLSDQMIHFGIEHHESDDSRLPERVFLLPNAGREAGGLLAHEFAHSWDGKFRRPADLSTPEFETPMKTDLLWVYEGLTTYLGNVLATRSGLWTPEDYHEYIAGIAASMGPGRPGRTWRPLLDTAVAVPGMFSFGGWPNWSRGSDYYEEGNLLWLEVAAIIHDQSHGEKSMDDFCREFFGGPNHGPELKTYTFGDIVNALNRVVAYDWAKFFHERLDSTSSEAPLGGLTASGWKLFYDSQPLDSGSSTGERNVEYSIGLSLRADGTVIDSIYNGPAFRAGITPGMKVVGVNGRLFTPKALGDAIKATRHGARTLSLLVLNNEYYKTCTIDYAGGERYPHLARIEGTPDSLDEILKPLPPR
jgi:predicted metalloprotease with PDZ domain